MEFIAGTINSNHQALQVVLSKIDFMFPSIKPKYNVIFSSDCLHAQIVQGTGGPPFTMIPLPLFLAYVRPSGGFLHW